MPLIFDNISHQLLPKLREKLARSTGADFCIGYFNLRGWRVLDDLVDGWQPEQGQVCRLLVGMQSAPEQELRKALSLAKKEGLDFRTAHDLKMRAAQQFRQQLTFGTPTAEDEEALHRLSRQLQSGKVVVKLFLRHQLHAKLYLCYVDDSDHPIYSYLGSSNLTLAGLSEQGELNAQIDEPDTTPKLQRWFEDRWQDKWCLDISTELSEVIENSWARSRALHPYYIYLKMAYHLSEPARDGLTEFRIPKVFGSKLFDFQTAAVQLAAHHINRRGGVLIGDVVGLGKTLMATAVARIFEDDLNYNTLIICPKNLVKMWESYVTQYGLRARIVPLSRVISTLTDEFPRFRLVIIDESHNLRNPDGKRYKAIRRYIERNESKVMLLTATPYNKDYRDLAAQLGLFVDRDKSIGLRPEALIREIGLPGFISKHNALVSSLAAFEQSRHAEDWRELMRLYLVRRTRSFIQQNYALEAEDGRRYLQLADGSRSFFPTRRPRRAVFRIDEYDPIDQYARLYSEAVVNTITKLKLPRYGLGAYADKAINRTVGEADAKLLEGLFRAGQRLLPFIVTNLFKRLESSGVAFLQSVERHVLRNYVFLHAIENNLPLPLGSQAASLLDVEGEGDAEYIFGDTDPDEQPTASSTALLTEAAFIQRAAEVYKRYQTTHKGKFRWLPSDLFTAKLKKDLRQDSRALLEVLAAAGKWRAQHDNKLNALTDLLMVRHPEQKVLVFTQFADTACYLRDQLAARGLRRFAAVTGDTPDPTAVAWRFSPRSNGKAVPVEQELRVLVSTDVLSEGQNLQDSHIVVNYDLPWAIIRLIQRAGRVDRIGQLNSEILAYSFLPADGIERIINLRGRLRDRLGQNAAVVGTDERFFEDESEQAVIDLYNEKVGILDGEVDDEVDLASFAYQIWRSATRQDQKLVESLPAVVYSTKPVEPQLGPRGALIYCRTSSDADALVWVNEQGEIVRQSQFDILQAAACGPDRPPLPRQPNHHEMVKAGVDHLLADAQRNSHEGRLGPRNAARRRLYERLTSYADREKRAAPLLYDAALDKAIQEVYDRPLIEAASETINRQLRSSKDQQLAELVLMLYNEDRLTVSAETLADLSEAHVICSLGLAGE